MHPEREEQDPEEDEEHYEWEHPHSVKFCHLLLCEAFSPEVAAGVVRPEEEYQCDEDSVRVVKSEQQVCKGATESAHDNSKPPDFVSVREHLATHRPMPS